MDKHHILMELVMVGMLLLACAFPIGLMLACFFSNDKGKRELEKENRPRRGGGFVEF